MSVQKPTTVGSGTEGVRFSGVPGLASNKKDAKRSWFSIVASIVTVNPASERVHRKPSNATTSQTTTQHARTKLPHRRASSVMQSDRAAQRTDRAVTMIYLHPALVSGLPLYGICLINLRGSRSVRIESE